METGCRNIGKKQNGSEKVKDLFRLLEMKKHCLMKFIYSCEQFLDLIPENSDKLSERLAFFENNRQSLLNIIKRTDMKIKDFLDKWNLDKLTFSSADKTKINYYIREYDSNIDRIIKLDVDVLNALEKIKGNCEAQIRIVKKAKNAISGYVKHDEVSPKINTQV